jgi:FkbH-like protein
MRALSDEYVRYLGAFVGKRRKVLVLDLDDTIWGGVLGECGVDGIALGPTYPGNAFLDVQRAILDLHRRGVVLAINSSNNEADAIEAMQNHPHCLLRPDVFSATRINWQDKAQNTIDLSHELGLSLDSFVFVDNSAAECERMKQALPEVLTVHLDGERALFAARIRALGVFDSLSYTDEDRQRGALYRDEARRTSLRHAVASLAEYYASLSMQLTIEPVTRSNVLRAADLTQRTNQFNLTTRRFTADALLEALRAPGRQGFVFRLKDRFGDQGTIGFAMLEGLGSERVVITDLLVSCRVLKRTVEDAIVAALVDHARYAHAREIAGRYRPSAKNASCADLYTRVGFWRDGEDADGHVFVRGVEPRFSGSPYITVAGSRSATV